jgi:hypothetical protein
MAIVKADQEFVVVVTLHPVKCELVVTIRGA